VARPSDGALRLQREQHFENSFRCLASVREPSFGFEPLTLRDEGQLLGMNPELLIGRDHGRVDGFRGLDCAPRRVHRFHTVVRRSGADSETDARTMRQRPANQRRGERIGLVLGVREIAGNWETRLCDMDELVRENVECIGVIGHERRRKMDDTRVRETARAIRSRTVVDADRRVDPELRRERCSVRLPVSLTRRAPIGDVAVPLRASAVAGHSLVDRCAAGDESRREQRCRDGVELGDGRMLVIDGGMPRGVDRDLGLVRGFA
jgi:hypothetical protein